MKNRKIKKLFMFIVIILIMMTTSNCVFASDDLSLQGIKEGGDKFLNNGENTGIQFADVKEITDSIYGVLLTIAIIAAVLVGTVLGIKFMLGSVEEKAEIKKTLTVYFVGCVIAFGAFTIWKIVIEILRIL